MTNIRTYIIRLLPEPKMNIAVGFLVFCQTLLVYVVFRVDPFADPDSLWHLAAGDLIRSTGSLPQTDTWSFTANGTFWYNLSWLWDAAASAINAYCGFGGLYALTLTIYALTLGLQAHLAVTQRAKVGDVILASYLCTCLTLASLFLRPGMMSCLFGVLTYQCLSYYRDTGKRLWLLPVPFIMLPWVNMHGGFLLCFVLCGIFLLEALSERRWQEFKFIFLCAAACALAALVNPYGLKVIDGAFRTLGSPLQNVIIEWLPMNATSSPHKIVLLAVLLLLVLSQFRDVGIRLSDRILAVVLVVAVVTSIRHIMLMSVLILPYLSHCLPHLKRNQISPDAKTKKSDAFGSSRALTAGLIICTLILYGYMLTPTPRDLWLGKPPGPAEDRLLGKEIAYIEKHHPDTLFYNHYDLGGALIYSARGKIPVFVDGREQTAYPNELIKDVMHLNAWQGWDRKSEEILSKYRVGGIIVPIAFAPALSANPRYKEVFKGPVAAIFIRQKK